MPSRKPGTPEHADDGAGMSASANTDSLELAEAEALEAETAATAARAKAEVLRLRRAAERAKAEAEAPEDIDAEESEDAEAEDGPEVVAVDEAAEDSEATEAPARTSRLGRAVRWVAAVVTVLIIGALIAAGAWIVTQHRNVQAQQQRTAEFEAAARQGVVTLMSLDYNKVDDNVKAIVDNSTGDFKKDFESAADDFKKTARESKAVTEASVSSAAVESSTETDAVVLVAATTKVTNAAGARQEPRGWRLSVNLVREGDQVKISKVEFVP